MKKVSILTFHYSENIGAMLQAYGLVQAIKSIGLNVEVIDYRPAPIRSLLNQRWPRRPLRLIKAYRYRNGMRKFREDFLPLSCIYKDPTELEQLSSETDCVVCGSDQVWNVRSPVRGYDPTFFLSFLDDQGPLRVSYAPSFGYGIDLGEHREEVCELLSRFDSISVRDSDSRHLVRDLIGRRVERVLDPCFLADYGAIAKKRKSKQPYLLAYCFQKTKLAVKALDSLQKKLQLPVVSIKTPFDNAKVVQPDPRQWLALIRDASYICTDSFHGACFSLINQKQFAIVPCDGRMSRLEDMLDLLGLNNRIIFSENVIERCCAQTVNYESVGPIVERERTASMAYLRKALLPLKLEQR